MSKVLGHADSPNLRFLCSFTLISAFSDCWKGILLPAQNHVPVHAHVVTCHCYSLVENSLLQACRSSRSSQRTHRPRSPRLLGHHSASRQELRSLPAHNSWLFNAVRKCYWHASAPVICHSATSTAGAEHAAELCMKLSTGSSASSASLKKSIEAAVRTMCSSIQGRPPAHIGDAPCSELMHSACPVQVLLPQHSPPLVQLEPVPVACRAPAAVPVQSSGAWHPVARRRSKAAAQHPWCALAAAAEQPRAQPGAAAVRAAGVPPWAMPKKAALLLHAAHLTAAVRMAHVHGTSRR